MIGSYKEIEGDLLNMFEKGAFGLIAHGCNCACLMGAGIAKAIAEAYPSAYYADRFSGLKPIEKLGHYSYDDCNGILNIYSQFNPGKDLNYAALTLALHKINIRFKGETIGLPQIGCGIAGGNWQVVREIIKKELCDMDVVVVIYKKQ